MALQIILVPILRLITHEEVTQIGQVISQVDKGQGIQSTLIHSKLIQTGISDSR